MKNLRKQSGYWKPCREGTILSVVDSKSRKNRRKFLVQIAMAGSLAATGLFSAFFLVMHHKNRQIADGGLDAMDLDGPGNNEISVPTLEECRETIELLSDYTLAFRLEQDNRSRSQLELIRKVDLHLKNCEGCTKLFDDHLAAV